MQVVVIPTELDKMEHDTPPFSHSLQLITTPLQCTHPLQKGRYWHLEGVTSNRIVISFLMDGDCCWVGYSSLAAQLLAIITHLYIQKPLALRGLKNSYYMTKLGMCVYVEE